MIRKFSLVELLVWFTYSCVLIGLSAQFGITGVILAVGPCWTIELIRTRSENLLDFLAAIALTIIAAILACSIILSKAQYLS